MVKTVSRAKAKKKKWVEIVSPKIFREKEIGDSHIGHPEELIGRQVSVNMMELTGNPRNQHIEVNFQIKELAEGKAQTFTRGFEIVPSAVKRYIRKGRNRIDDSFVAKTKDGFAVRVKPIVVTHSKTTKEVQTKIRLAVKDDIKKALKKKKYSEALDEILNFKLQKNMKKKFTTIHPIRTLEIRSLSLLDNEKIPEDLQLSEKKEEQEADSKADSEKDDSKTSEDDEKGDDSEEKESDDEESKDDSDEEESGEEAPADEGSSEGEEDSKEK